LNVTVELIVSNGSYIVYGNVGVYANLSIVNSSFIVGSNLVIKGDTILKIIGSNLIIEGNFTTGNTTVIYYEGKTPVSVHDCAHFEGSLVVDVSVNTQSVQLFNYSCYNGTFDNVSVTGTNDTCIHFTTEYQTHGLFIYFNTNCSSPSIDFTLIIALAVAIPMFFILLGTVVILSPGCRHYLLPYHDRKSVYVYSTKNPLPSGSTQYLTRTITKNDSDVNP